MEVFNKSDDIDRLRNALKDQKETGGNWTELFTVVSNRKSLWLIIACRLFQQLCGSICLIFYAQTIFHKILIINGMIIDKIGRRPLLVASMSTITVALLIISVYFCLQNMTEIKMAAYSWCPVVGLFLYIIGYSLGLQNVLYLLLNEIFPLHVKSAAIAMFSVVYGISSTAITKFFQYTKDEYGLHVPFVAFLICSAIGVPFFWFCIPETKKQTLEAIEKRIRCKDTRL
ncbi:hypothetical protein FQR65_LT07569 [Abscondita terminalis]|nr:hypothetical protein FQR65_LT07569 [Abscondita terminalis]